MPLIARSTPAPDPVDVHVGAQLRSHRQRLGWGQQRLARHLGVSFQQLQKYESGTNRVSASVMYRAATAMDIKPSDLFDGFGSGPAPEGALIREATEIARCLERATPALRTALRTLVEEIGARP